MQPLSTYHVAFAFNDYAVISQRSEKHDILVEVAARPQAIQNGDGDFALNISSLMLDYFVDYLAVEHALEKSSKPVYFGQFYTFITSFPIVLTFSSNCYSELLFKCHGKLG